MTPVQRIVLAAEDKEADRLILSNVWERVLAPSCLRFVQSGDELLDYLQRRGRYTNANGSAPRPDMILLDLRMPGTDGIQCIREIRKLPETRTIPICVLTVSDDQDDIDAAYAAGASTYFVKPLDMNKFEGFARMFNAFWFGQQTAAQLPSVKA